MPTPNERRYPDLFSLIDAEVEAVMDSDDMTTEGQDSLLRRLGSLSRNLNRKGRLTPANKKTLVNDVYNDVGSVVEDEEEIPSLNASIEQAVSLGVSRAAIMKAVRDLPPGFE